MTYLPSLVLYSIYSRFHFLSNILEVHRYEIQIGGGLFCLITAKVFGTDWSLLKFK